MGPPQGAAPGAPGLGFDDVSEDSEIVTRRAMPFRRAVRWSYILDGGQQFGNVVTTFVLAALLGPEVYGLVALALVYVLFVELVLKQGMVSAIVQRRRLSADHADSAFWLVLASSLVLAVVSVSLSGWWASANDLPSLRPIIWALSLTLPLKGVVIVQDALLRRAMDFRLLAIRTGLSVVGGAAIGIAGALGGMEEWALVAQQLAVAAIGAITLWAVADWRPRVRFSARAARDLLGFSTGSFLASIGVFVNNKADIILNGLLFGPVAAGLYRLAFRVVDTIVDVTSRSLQSVALPELSRLQDQRQAFARRLLGIISVSAVLAFPTLAVLAVCGDAFLSLLGPEWEAATNALMVLCMVGAARSVVLFLAPMLQALGHPHMLAGYSWGSAAVNTGALVVTGLAVQGSSTADQVMWMAICRATVFGVALIVSAAMLVRLCEVRTTQLLAAVRPGVLSALAGASGALAVRIAIGVGNPGPVISILVAGLAGVASAGAALVVCAPEYRRFVSRSAPVVRLRRQRDIAVAGRRR